MTATASQLKQTPLNAIHRQMGGRMVDFGGWDMPVQYPAGTIEEHLRTRTHAGLFDVSHMGEIDVRGPDAIAFVNRLTSNDVRKLVDGQAQYTALTTAGGQSSTTCWSIVSPRITCCSSSMPAPLTKTGSGSSHIMPVNPLS